MILVADPYKLDAKANNSWPSFSQFTTKSLLPYHFLYSPPFLCGNHFFRLCCASLRVLKPIPTFCHAISNQWRRKRGLSLVCKPDPVEATSLILGNALKTVLSCSPIQ